MEPRPWPRSLTLNGVFEMKRFLCFIVGVFCFAFVLSGSASAQTFDAFGGYSFDHFSVTPPGTTVTTTAKLNGGEGTVGFYPMGIFGVVGDVSAYHFSQFNGSNGVNVPVKGNVVTYLFGPKVRFPFGPVKPFAEVLFGGARFGNVTTDSSSICSTQVGTPPPCTVESADNSFALSADGGVDVKFARHFALRGQAGYLMTRFNMGVNNSDITQNNVRISVGIVIE
jgi:hypothetical protein